MYNKNIIDDSHTIFPAVFIADACDQIPGKTMLLPLEIKNRINDKKIVSPAVTIHEDVTDEKLPPQYTLDTTDKSANGLVIVITGSLSPETVAVWGGLMTAGAVVNKHEAAVSNGGVRDLAKTRHDHNFPVYVRAVTPGTVLGRFKTVSTNQPVTIGDVTVNPGDLIVGDTDGVVCVPQTVAAEVLALVQSTDSRELEWAKLIIQSDSLHEGLAKYGQV